MKPRVDILPALRAACHAAVAHYPCAFVRRHLDAGDHVCVRLGPSLHEVANEAGVSLEQARRALFRELAKGRVQAEIGGRPLGLRWWPHGMAGELWESTGA